VTEVTYDRRQIALNYSETKYCAVGAMISKTAKIDTTFEILPGITHDISPEAA
jgi:uncharacterized OsmC-like protein